MAAISKARITDGVTAKLTRADGSTETTQGSSEKYQQRPDDKETPDHVDQ